MSLLALSGLSFEFPSSPVLFEDVSFSVNPADRVAIVGPNGSGKSTLLRLIAANLEPSRGRVIRQRNLRIAVADQEIPPALHQTLFEFVLGAYQGRSGFAEADALRTLSGLGYRPPDFDRDVQSLSGGERTRAALARALSIDADLLILDEPTNHLDIQGREWLEASLALHPAACIITSHDRALLSAFAKRIVEIERAKVTVFETDYAGYRRARALLNRQAWSAYEAFERRKAVLTRAAHHRKQLSVKVATAPAGVRSSRDFYARKAAKVARTGRILRERANGGKADEQRVDKPWEEQSVDGLTFDRVARSGDVVLTGAALTKSYGSKILFRDLSFHVRRGDRLAIVGPNGSGKTTLLNVIQGATLPDSGSVHFGANVDPASVEQNPSGLDLSRTPLEICSSDTSVRTLFACLKLRPDRLNRPLHELSGGERTKVALTRILTSGANLLLLDEPTNHLEIEAQEALEQALRIYPGTVIVVSHDRVFLGALGPELVKLTLISIE